MSNYPEPFTTFSVKYCFRKNLFAKIVDKLPVIVPLAFSSPVCVFQLQDILDNEYLKSLTKPSSQDRDEPKRGANGPGFSVKNAPWDAPDTTSTSEFPSFPSPAGEPGAGSAVAPKASWAWGPSRRK